jgi:hypothetical protein
MARLPLAVTRVDAMFDQIELSDELQTLKDDVSRL